MSILVRITILVEFCPNEYDLNGILKIDLEVVETFWDRFWKAQMPLCRSPTFIFEFRSFRNLNGILKSHPKFSWIFNVYRSGSKYVSKTKNLLMQLILFESMDCQLSKTVPIIAPRLLDQILWQIEVQSKRPKKEGGVWKKIVTIFK